MNRKLLSTLVITMFVASCGGSQEPSSTDVEKEVKETLRRARNDEKITETRSGLDPCAILASGIVAETFGIEPGVLSFRAGSTRHPVCIATWRKPNADEIEAGSAERMMDYMKRKMAAKSKSQPFDEPMPIARAEAEVSLTVNDERFGSEAAAAARLEEIVATMEKGISVEVQGKTHASQTDYDDWTPGVGDRAAWAPKLSQLSVAARGVVFHVAVRATDDRATNRERAIELARAVAAQL